MNFLFYFMSTCSFTVPYLRSNMKCITSFPFYFRNKIKIALQRIHRHCRQYTRILKLIQLYLNTLFFRVYIIILKTCLYFLLLDYDRRNASLSVTDKPDTTNTMAISFLFIYLFYAHFWVCVLCAIFIHKVLSKIYFLLIL